MTKHPLISALEQMREQVANATDGFTLVMDINERTAMTAQHLAKGGVPPKHVIDILMFGIAVSTLVLKAASARSSLADVMLWRNEAINEINKLIRDTHEATSRSHA